MKRILLSAALAFALAAPLRAARIDWVPAASDANIAHAFALARDAHKPLLLYWGASWCPPCNQLQATLFNRQDFIERSREFVAVHIDGDLPGAQKLGTRFKVRGYPTLVLLRSDGTEVTRLPGEADAPQVLRVLQLGLAGGRPVKALLADALAGKPLGANEWTSLAFYPWDTDEEQLAPAAERPGLLASLAAACPAAQKQTRTRLWLKALAASDDGKGVKADPALRRLVLGVLEDAQAARREMDVLSGAPAEIARALTTREAGGDRAGLLAAYDRALARLESDASLSRADRLGALLGRVDLARLDVPEDATQVKLPAALLADVRRQVARDDAEISDGYERQAVITGAAYVLVRAGLMAESDALLEANLARSHSPYYLMSQLAGNAKRRGDAQGALAWYERAFDASVGPATRLQWGASYVNALVDLAPDDAARIERAASKVFAEAAAQPDAFYERSGRSLQKIGQRLASWSAGGKHAEAMTRLRRQLESLCGKLDAADAQRGQCEKLLAPGAG